MLQHDDYDSWIHLLFIHYPEQWTVPGAQHSSVYYL